MANCCTAKGLSWVVAILHIVLGIIGAIAAIICLCAPRSAYDDPELEVEGKYLLAFFIILLIYSVAVLGCSIALIMGLKKDRPKLMQPFIYVLYLGMLCTAIISIRMFFRGLKEKKSVGGLALELFSDVLFVGFQCLLLSPVYLLYRRMNAAPRFMPEQHALSNNEPVNKPYYPVQA